jgi:hypothetical protein
VGVVLRARDLGALRHALKKARLRLPDIVHTASGRSMFLPPTLTHGIWLEFRELP